MDSVIEISDIPMVNIGDKPRSINTSSSNFGSGIELLMNDKVKSGSSGKGASLDFPDIEELSNLEFELNELAQPDTKETFKPVSYTSKSKGSDVRFASINIQDNKSSDDMETININSTIGESTAYDEQHSGSTWDGFSKINTTINPDRAYAPAETTMSKEELLREKFKILKKIETLEKKGVEFTKKYNMDSPLNEMLGEYETIMDERSKQGSIKFQGNMLISIVNGIEYLNNKLDYLDIKLEGWSEQVNDNLTDYDDIFGELYDQYKDQTAISPWLRLMFQLGGSAFMIHLTNTMFKSSMPSMDDIFRQNPDLMKTFQSAAINTMGQSSPGFHGFMNSVSGGAGSQHQQPSQSAPNRYDDYVTQTRGGNNSYGSATTSTSLPIIPQNTSVARSSVNQYPANDKRPSNNVPASSTRPEMKGPGDINDILSRLKPKQSQPSDAPERRPYTQLPSNPMQFAPSTTTNMNENSTISLSELSEIHADVSLPKKSRRKPKSDKNTISLSL